MPWPSCFKGTAGGLSRASDLTTGLNRRLPQLWLNRSRLLLLYCQALDGLKVGCRSSTGSCFPAAGPAARLGVSAIPEAFFLSLLRALLPLSLGAALGCSSTDAAAALGVWHSQESLSLSLAAAAWSAPPSQLSELMLPPLLALGACERLLDVVGCWERPGPVCLRLHIIESMSPTQKCMWWLGVWADTH